MIRALVASLLVLGAFAQYAQLNEYVDSACSILINQQFYPSSSTGTCTALSSGSSPYSLKATDSSLSAYDTIDCSGTVTFSEACSGGDCSGGYDCLNTGATPARYFKMARFNTALNFVGGKSSIYVGTDASTDTCAASTGVYYKVVPFDTCVYYAASDYRKYSGCDSVSQVQATFGRPTVTGAYWLHTHYALYIDSAFTV